MRTSARARLLPEVKSSARSLGGSPIAPFFRRVLRFVDEDVVDAGIEFVEHPGGVGPAQQRQSALDQIVEIEQAAPRLEPRGSAARIAAARSISTRLRASVCAALALSRSAISRSCSARSRAFRPGKRALQRLGDHLAHRRRRAARPGFRKEHRKIGFYGGRQRRRKRPSIAWRSEAAKSLSFLLPSSSWTAMLDQPARPPSPRQHGAFDRCDIFPRREAEDARPRASP